VRQKCPTFRCNCGVNGPKSGRLWSNGRYYRRSDSRKIARFICADCGKSGSQATGHPCFRQKKRRINKTLFRLLCSGVSLRRSAKLLKVHRTTVTRRFRFLAEQSRLEHAEWLRSFEDADRKINEVLFDEMETFEHTKLKPLSIALAVTAKREIIAAEVARMPAKGLLAKRARKKYGFRRDERPKALGQLFKTLQPLTNPNACFKSDQSPHYPKLLKHHFPTATHETTKGLRGCVVGQGELKATSWDPLFALNHTAAMFRANMNRLFRRTWCTTKIPQGLKDHIALYVRYHNSVLLPKTVSC
jgi:transposase-like protein